MAAEGKLVTNPEVVAIMRTATLCKLFGCLPTHLRGEDPDELDLVAAALSQLKTQNPFG